MRCQCESLETLGHNWGKEYASAHLEQVAVDQTNCLVLYKCPKADIFWRKSYPRSEEHGGGPALFEKITQEQAVTHFQGI